MAIRVGLLGLNYGARVHIPIYKENPRYDLVAVCARTPGRAEAIAREGVEVALKGVPLGSFGKFLTVDRGEIEGFRSIRALMREYDAEPAPRPLNIAVFGPPGAGKSFGVKAVAKSALDGDRIEELPFNLSQMRDSADLADALEKSVDDFRNKKLFDFGFSDPSRVEVKGAGYSKAGDKWTANGKTMDNASVQTLIDKLRDLAATWVAR